MYFEYKGFTVNIVSSTIHTHGGGKSLKGSQVSLIIPIDGVDYVAGAGFGDLPFSAMPFVHKGNSPIIHDINGDYHAMYVNDYLFYVRKMGKDNDNNWDHTMKRN
ncbi:arylamine N-acetyltransferase [Staphylococcus aureus]|uniref:arylamine N-acetyltransferase n=1 Tax=Staphylococcus aureus TaxID=1280 RepID=UPI002030ECB3|nr:arylamine N-acetyltransferase [Staphylococcus aureus]